MDITELSTLSKGSGKVTFKHQDWSIKCVLNESGKWRYDMLKRSPSGKFKKYWGHREFTSLEEAMNDAKDFIFRLGKRGI